MGRDSAPFPEKGTEVPSLSRDKGTTGQAHTAGLDTIFVQIYMDPPPGLPGVSKNQNFFFTNKTVEFLR